MKRFYILYFLSLFLFLCHVTLKAQKDSLFDELKSKLINNVSHFTFGFYVDSYVTIELDNNKDTLNTVPFFANCPMRDQVRLNVAAFEGFYNAETVRGKIQLQFGDAPNLLASADKQWIKMIRQATVGFRVVKNFWIDAGYMFTPVGCESAWPVINVITTASICAYFEAGAVLGVKASYKISDKVEIGAMAGNPYSLAYQQSNHLAGVLYISYTPLKNLSLSYNNLFGNQALKNAEIKNNLLYNDVLITYDPIPKLNLMGQCDFAFQTNSQRAPDTTKTASMISGFVLAKYHLFKKFSVTGRYEWFSDPQGFLTGVYNYDGKSSGLTMNGCSIGLEYKPVKFAYIRMEYKYLQANKGNMVYYSGNSDHLNALIFNTGIRF